MLIDFSPHVVMVSVRPLILACQSGRTEVAEILLEAGMDPNAMEDRSGTSPLHEAVRFFRQEIARLLLQFGADPDSENRQNEVGVWGACASEGCNVGEGCFSVCCMRTLFCLTAFLQTPRAMVSAMSGPKGDKFALLFDGEAHLSFMLPQIHTHTHTHTHTLAFLCYFRIPVVGEESTKGILSTC